MGVGRVGSHLFGRWGRSPEKAVEMLKCNRNLSYVKRFDHVAGSRKLVDAQYHNPLRILDVLTIFLAPG